MCSIEPELLSVRNWSKSFVKRLNRRGLRMQLCRIPILHANDFDSSWFTHILDDACPYMLCRMASILVFKPTVANFSHSRPWCTLSKALEKSMKHVQRGFLFFLNICVMVFRMKIASVVLLFPLNPNCDSFSMPLASAQPFHLVNPRKNHAGKDGTLPTYVCLDHTLSGLLIKATCLQ